MMGQPGIDFPGVGTGLVVLNDNKILLCKRLKAPEALHWSIPGGKVDHLELSQQAAMRETYEETGLKIFSVKFLCLSEKIIPADKQHWISTIFIADGFEGELQLMEPDKLSEIGWFDLSALPQPLSQFAIDAIEALKLRAN
jgi:ADP-ribose pyrophosphatase YjhB (NUDIX family)